MVIYVIKVRVFLRLAISSMIGKLEDTKNPLIGRGLNEDKALWVLLRSPSCQRYGTNPNAITTIRNWYNEQWERIT